ncbi:MAG: hypothetical protein JXB36_20040 [Gammaproteobacteria bacterium]|nr:hypothetical protein [Gammaproteobacteria bacterium]
MGQILNALRSIALPALAAAALGTAVQGRAADEAAAPTRSAGRHDFSIQIDTAWNVPSSPFSAWVEGGLGKLRYDESDRGLNAARIFVDYRARLKPGLTARIVADHVGDGGADADGVDVGEAYLEWRPVPTSANRHRLRTGAFYPPLSLENGGPGWSSPFGVSFSAINTWLGEEIRPIGVEWSMRRRTRLGSPQEIGVFAAGFYGNDPAGTLLFWRGWSLHDRQTRLHDRLPMPPLPLWSDGAIVGHEEQWLEPFDEIDGKPGGYAGVEWRYGRRALVQLSRYDNRADPYAFSGGQWGWHTRFNHLSAQLALPRGFGLIAQWLDGSTDWLTATTPDGRHTPFTEHVEDTLEAKYVMLTRLVRDAHRVSLRYDGFEVRRDEAPPQLVADSGRAWTLAYRYERPALFDVTVEWQQIGSRRDLWPFLYGAQPRARERILSVGVVLRLDSSRLR